MALSKTDAPRGEARPRANPLMSWADSLAAPNRYSLSILRTIPAAAKLSLSLSLCNPGACQCVLLMNESRNLGSSSFTSSTLLLYHQKRSSFLYPSVFFFFCCIIYYVFAWCGQLVGISDATDKPPWMERDIKVYTVYCWLHHVDQFILFVGTIHRCGRLLLILVVDL